MDKFRDSYFLQPILPDDDGGELLTPKVMRLPSEGWSSVPASDLAVLDGGEFSAWQLKSVMTDLCMALRSAVNGEYDIVNDSLRRVEEILSLNQPNESVGEELRGGLCPWQIRKVTTHIAANLDRPIQNGDLATIVQLTSCYFGRAFRNSFGMPPHEYVIRRRVERAQGLMLSTRAPLSQIALDCGLSDQAHLSRLFRRVVGESPRTWRRARISISSD